MKRFITYTFLSSRDNQKLKPSLHLCRQDASKYISGDLKKRGFLGLTPSQDFDPITLCANFATYRKYLESKCKKSVFPLTEAYRIIIQKTHHANKKVF